MQTNPADINPDQKPETNQSDSSTRQLLSHKNLPSGQEPDGAGTVHQELIRAESLLHLARIENENIVDSLTWKVSSKLRYLVEGNPIMSRLAYAFAARFVRGKTRPDDKKASYQEWLKANDRLKATDYKTIAQQIQSMASPPLFSILLCVKQVDKQNLVQSLSTVFGQLYPHWELLVLHAPSADPESIASIKKILSCHGSNNIQSVRVSNTAELQHGALLLNQAKGQYIVFLQSGDRLALQALYMIAVAAGNTCRPAILYSDEDFIDPNNNRFAPYFKPDWNPDLFFSQNYIHNLCALNRTAINPDRRFGDLLDVHAPYNMVLNAIEDNQNKNIIHLPFVLYHNLVKTELSKRSGIDLTGFQANPAALRQYFSRNAIAVHIRQGLPNTGYQIQYLIPKPAPLVSIIIPTAGHKLSVLSKLIKDLVQNTSYAPIEIKIVVNNIRKTKKLAAIKRFETCDQVQLLSFNGPFNHSAINNYARQFTSGSLLCFLNDDIQTIHPTWLTEMAGHALRSEIGAVGAKLYYPSNLIQHGGMILGCGGTADHVFRGRPRNGNAYFQNMDLVRNYSAVTAACMVMRKTVFDEVGGFDENLPVAYNDVDLCLRIREKGYRILWTPHAELFHHDALSRKALIPSLDVKIRKDMETLQQKWAPELVSDPAFNPNLRLQSNIFTLAAASRIRKPWKSEL